jgi:hypothetical protein
MRITGESEMYEGYLPGIPHRWCIRMPGKMAEILFNNVDLGTPRRDRGLIGSPIVVVIDVGHFSVREAGFQLNRGLFV